MSNKEQTFQTSAKKIDFLGSPYGEGADRLEHDMSARLATIPEVTGAFFCMVRHANEENDRLSLLIASDHGKNDYSQSLAQNCSGLIPMDLMFIEDLSDKTFATIKLRCNCFYTTDTL